MSAKSPTVSSEADSEQEFVHQIAIEVSEQPWWFVGPNTISDIRDQMSRLMNSMNPNDLLARRVIEIAKGNRSSDAFIRGIYIRFVA